MSARHSKEIGETLSSGWIAPLCMPAGFAGRVQWSAGKFTIRNPPGFLESAEELSFVERLDGADPPDSRMDVFNDAFRNGGSKHLLEADCIPGNPEPVSGIYPARRSSGGTGYGKERAVEK